MYQTIFCLLVLENAQAEVEMGIYWSLWEWGLWSAGQALCPVPTG